MIRSSTWVQPCKRSRLKAYNPRYLWLCLSTMLASAVLCLWAAPNASALTIGIMSADESWETEEGWNGIAHSGATVFRAAIGEEDYYSPERWAKVKAMFRFAAERNITILPYLYRGKNDSQQFLTKAEWEPPGNPWETFVYGVVQSFGYNGSFWTEPGHPTNYKPAGFWEVWNEPNLPINNPGGQTAQPENYARFLIRTASAIQEAQGLKTPGSGTQVLFGGLYSNGGMSVGEFLEKAHNVAGTGVAFSGLSLHPYSFQGGSWGVEQYVNDARSKLTKFFGNKQLWITELGWNVPPWSDQNHPAVAESQQAEYLTSSFNWIKSVAGEYNIPAAIWYIYRDSNACEAWDCHTGLRAGGASGTFRPAWTAFQAQTGAAPWYWHTDNLGGNITEDPDISSWGPNRLDVWARAPNGSFEHKWWLGNGWEGPEYLANPGTIVSGVGAVGSGGNRIDVVGRTPSNSVIDLWWTGASWQLENFGGEIVGDPDMSAIAGHFDIWARSPSGTLMHKWWTGSSWSSWQDMGIPIASSPGAVEWGETRADVVARASDNTVTDTWWNGSTFQTTNLGGNIVGAPDIASWGPGRLDIFARGENNTLMHKWYDETHGWSSWESLGGSLASSPGAVSWGNGRIDVVARASDNSILHWWWSNG